VIRYVARGVRRVKVVKIALRIANASGYFLERDVVEVLNS